MIKYNSLFRFRPADEAAVKIEVMVRANGETEFRALEPDDIFDADDLIRLGCKLLDLGREIMRSGFVDPDLLARSSDKEEGRRDQ